MREETNYDEYNRNNNMINKIRFNNRYNNYNDLNESQMINENINNNPNNYQQNQINISQSQNNINNSQNYRNNNINENQNENMNNSVNNKSMINTINKNDFFNYPNNNNYYNNDMNNNNNNIMEENYENNNIPNNQNNNNLYKSQDINIGLNEWVRNDLVARGLHVGRSVVSPRSIRMSQLDRKKTLLENIQAQINLKKRNKLEELNKRKQEDAKYLQDMVIFYPFGRGGGGAPNRDKSGNVIAYRRALISDPKYNFASINVDDDYDEVWNKEKRIGRFYKNAMEPINNNNININNENNQNQDFNNKLRSTPQYIQSNPRPYSTFIRTPSMNNNPNFNNQHNLRSRIPIYNENINKNNELLLKLKEQNEILRRQLDEEKENDRLRKELEKEEEKNKILNENKNMEKEEDEIVNNYESNEIIEREIIDPNSIILDKDTIEKINRSEIESRNKLNNEIYRLRSQMQNQQMLLFQQISNLKNEAEKANSEREEALREIEKLKMQIYQGNKEDRKKRYIHHVIVSDNGEKNTEKSIQTEQPKNNEDALELNKLLKKNIDRLNYLEEIERLNAIRRSPPSNYELEFPKNNVIPEKEEEDDDLYEIEISKVHN